MLYLLAFLLCLISPILGALLLLFTGHIISAIVLVAIVFFTRG